MSRLPGLLAGNQPLVMGILNVTPDSFSDGGRFVDLPAALGHAQEMIEAGAVIIDIGGESTRPGATHVTAAEEIDRVLPVIHALRKQSGVAISLDSSKAEVMRAAVWEDIDLINDVRALREPVAMEVAAESGLPVCLMHMQGEPDTMQHRPVYQDVVSEVFAFFESRITACEAAGISRQGLLLDVGFGFGKTPEHNLMLINRLSRFSDLGLPLLVGLSRKSTIGRIADDLLSGSIAGALSALNNGAKVLRVHDVGQTVAAIRVWRSIAEERIVDANS